MENALTLDQEISLLLIEKIREPNICKDIIFLKNEMEKEETYKYHYERWETIASKYFKAIDGKFRHISYVQDGEKFVFFKDVDTDFYRETGISHQVKDIIHELICSSDKLNREYTDSIYGILAKAIMYEMKQ
jgi:hypothetical protein